MILLTNPQNLEASILGIKAIWEEVLAYTQDTEN